MDDWFAHMASRNLNMSNQFTSTAAKLQVWRNQWRHIGTVFEIWRNLMKLNGKESFTYNPHSNIIVSINQVYTAISVTVSLSTSLTVEENNFKTNLSIFQYCLVVIDNILKNIFYESFILFLT